LFERELPPERPKRASVEPKRQLKVKQPKQLVQAYVPEWNQREWKRELGKELMIVLQRGPTFVCDRHRDQLTRLKAINVGLKLEEKPYGNGVIVTLKKE